MRSLFLELRVAGLCIVLSATPACLARPAAPDFSVGTDAHSGPDALGEPDSEHHPDAEATTSDTEATAHDAGTTTADAKITTTDAEISAIDVDISATDAEISSNDTGGTDGSVSDADPCDPACEHETVETWACTAGACRVVMCVQGLTDDDGDADNGCEETIGPTTVRHLNADLGNDTLGDGSAEQPWFSLAYALTQLVGGETLLMAPGEYSAGVDVIAPGDVTIDGSGPGETILYTGAAYAGIDIETTGVTVRDLTVEGGGAGIYIRGEAGASHVEVHNVELRDIDPGDSWTGAYGIRVMDTEAITIRDVWIHDLTAAPGANTGDPLDALGGRGYGIYIDNVSGCSVLGGRIERVSGGAAADGLGDGGNEAGHARGVRVQTTHDLQISHLVIDTIVGGAVSDQEGVLTTTMGAAGGWAYGIEVDFELIGQEQAQGVQITGNRVSNVHGGKGGKATVPGQPGGDGGRAVGIQVDDAADVHLLDNVITGLVAGDAGAATDGVWGSSGFAYGVRIQDVSSATVQRLVVIDVSAGGSSEAAGLRIGNTTLSAIEDLEIRRIRGGDLQPGETIGGDGVGVRMEDSAVDSMDRLLVHDLTAGMGALMYRGAVCVWVEPLAELTIRNLSCAGLNAPADVWSRGVVHAMGGSEPVHLIDSIISGARDACVHGSAGLDSADETTAGSTILHGCETPLSKATASGPNLTEDPRFVDSGGGDLHLAPDSPGIDAGSPLSPWEDEPAPNGCRANMGVYGGTSEATSAPDATCDE